MLKTWFPIISWFSLQIEIEFRTFVFGPPAAGDEIVFLCLGRDQKLVIKTSIIIYQIQTDYRYRNWTDFQLSSCEILQATRLHSSRGHAARFTFRVGLPCTQSSYALDAESCVHTETSNSPDIDVLTCEEDIRMDAICCDWYYVSTQAQRIRLFLLWLDNTIFDSGRSCWTTTELQQALKLLICSSALASFFLSLALIDLNPCWLRAIIFDNDGTLASSLVPHVEFCHRMNEKHGCGLDLPLTDDLEGMRRYGQSRIRSRGICVCACLLTIAPGERMGKRIFRRRQFGEKAVVSIQSVCVEDVRGWRDTHCREKEIQ